MKTQINIVNFASEFSRVAYMTIHDEELLEDVNQGIALYRDGMITKTQLNKIYKNAKKHMDYLIKLKQFQIETDYHNEVNNRLYVEFNTIDETEESTYKYNDDIPDDVVYIYICRNATGNHL